MHLYSFCSNAVMVLPLQGKCCTVQVIWDTTFVQSRMSNIAAPLPTKAPLKPVTESYGFHLHPSIQVIPVCICTKRVCTEYRMTLPVIQWTPLITGYMTITSQPIPNYQYPGNICTSSYGGSILHIEAWMTLLKQEYNQTGAPVFLMSLAG